MTSACVNCRYWRADRTDPEVGYCKRYAPRPSMGAIIRHDSGTAETVDHAIWPLTMDDDWCGQFRAKRKP